MFFHPVSPKEISEGLKLKMVYLFVCRGSNEARELGACGMLCK